ncbi:transposable element Tcb1 transposase [Trichonephila clavipes]|nr:transposable element Tcb1 transposase [Trichonephila clavipes]
MLLPESNHWEVGGRPQCDKCGCRARNCSQHRFTTLGRQFQTTGTAIRGSVVVVHEEPHPQITGTLSYRPEETGGRQREKSLDTRHRRLDDRYRVLPWLEDCLFARRPVRCVPLTPAHRRRHESRFSLSSDSHRILIWREGSHNHPSNIIERDRYGGNGVLVWGGIMLGSRTDLHIFDAGSVNGTHYCNEILLPYVRLFRGAMGLQFLFMDDNAPCHRTVAAEQLLESEDIERMDWPARSPDLNPIEHVWDFLGRRLAARTLPPVTIRELRLAHARRMGSNASTTQLTPAHSPAWADRCETCRLSSLRGRSLSPTKDRMFLALDTHHSGCFSALQPRIAPHATFFNQASFLSLLISLSFRAGRLPSMLNNSTNPKHMIQCRQKQASRYVVVGSNNSALQYRATRRQVVCRVTDP